MSMSETNAKTADTARRLGRQFAALREEIRERGRRSPLVAAAAGLALAGLAYAGYGHFATARPAAPAAVQSAPVGQQQTVEFVVAGGKKFDRYTLLNSERDWRSAGNLTVKVNAPVEVPVGRTVVATGTVGEYRGHRQLVCEAAGLSVR
jgi:hypothetical protein